MVFLAAISNLYALDAGLSFHMGNFDFAANRASTDTGFTGSNYSWGIDGSLTQPVGDALTASISYTMDPVLRNLISAGIRYNGTYFSISGGPLFGILNTGGTLLHTGLRATITAQIPGIVFLTLDSGSTIGGQLVKVGDYSENLSEVIAGVYVKNAICSLHIADKGFVEKTALGNVETTLREYSFQTDAFQKNVPYTAKLKFGYQIQSRYYDYSTPITQTLGSLVLAAHTGIRLNELLSLNAGLEANIYTFGLDSLAGLSINNLFLFRATTGVSFHLDTTNGKKKGL